MNPFLNASCARLAGVLAVVFALGVAWGGALPDGYTRVAYVQGDGSTARIVTDFTVNPQTDRIEADVALTRRDGTCTIWCARGKDTGVLTYTLFWVSNANFRFDYNGSTSAGAFGADAAIGTRYSITTDGNVVSWNGGSGYAYANASAFTAAGGPLVLFASYYNGTGSNKGNWGTHRLYAFRIYRNDELVHDLVPCTDADGNATLYDTCGSPLVVTREGTFAAGGEISSAEIAVLPVADQAYAGAGVPHPQVVVSNKTTAATFTVGGDSPAAGEAFAVDYSEVRKDGKVTVRVTGKAGTDYAGAYGWTQYGVSFDGYLGTWSYKPSGRVFVVDALENAGIGSHDTSATVWKDLAGSVDLTLTANGKWGENYFDVCGLSAAATGATPVYRTIEVVYRMTNGVASTLFVNGNGSDPERIVTFTSATRALFSRGHCVTRPYVDVKPYSAETDWKLAATYNGYGQSEYGYTNGVKITGCTLNTGGRYNAASVAQIGAHTTANGNPWYGRLYAIRAYDHVLTEAELTYNAALDDIRFFGRTEAEAFTGDLRWNGTTKKAEARIAPTLVAGNGSFTVNGAAGAAWVTVGETVTVAYVPAAGEVPLSWSELPYGATVAGDTLSVTFVVTGAIAPRFQLKTVFSNAGSLIADGEFEDGAGYAYDGGHVNGWVYRWTRSGDRCQLGRIAEGDPDHGFSYLNNYQANYAQQAGVVIPAGDYTLSFDYKYASSTPFNLYFALIDSGNVSRTLVNIVTDEQRDGTAWHTVEVPVTVAADGLYTFRVGSSDGGNRSVYCDNVRFTSKTDLTIDPVGNQPYLGAQVCPEVVVRDASGNILTNDVDYTLLWGANNAAGNGYVAAVGKGTHFGVAGANFLIGKPIFVKPDGVSSADGTTWETAVDFATALSKATAGSAPWEIWVTGSNVMTAAATVRKFNANVLLRGGFAGYELAPGERVPGAFSVLDGAGAYDVINWKAFTNVQFERFRFQNCPGRVLQSPTAYQGGLTLEDCVFVDNATSASTSAIYLNCAAGKEHLTLKNCRFLGHPEAGARPYGAGALVYMAAGGVKATDCEFTDFLGNKSGSLIYLAGASTGSSFDHCLFRGNTYVNACVSFNHDAVARTIDVNHCTFAHNTGGSTGAGVALNGTKGTLTVRNSIFYGNANATVSVGADIMCSASAPCDLDYCLFEADDPMHLALGSTASVKGAHLQTGDPLFVSETDVHLLSEAGYFDATGAVHYAEEGVISSAIDAGDPAAPYARELSPNGMRVNLGYYGNTAQASYSLFGPDTPSDYPHLTIRRIKDITSVGCTVSYRIDFTDPADLYILYGENPSAPAYTNVIPSAARIGSYVITGLKSGVDYFVKLYARAEDGRDGACDPVWFSTVSIGSQSYVSDGLVMQLDGFDNVARGVHDSKTNVWNDLVGNLDLTLTANGSFGDGWLDVCGKSAVAGTVAPTYRTIEVLCRMTNATGNVVFASGIDAYHLLLFNDSGTRCDFSRLWYGAGNAYLPLTYLATLDRCISAVHRSDSLIDRVCVNGARAVTGWDAGAYRMASTSVATIGAYGDGTCPWYGRIYALRLYNRPLTDSEIQLNGAVDLVRYQGASPEQAFTGDFRWNTTTRQIEAHCTFATDGGQGGYFTINGVETNDVWLAVGRHVDVLYTSGLGENNPLEWHGLPVSAVISNELRCVGFTVSAAVNATLQISRAGDRSQSLIADSGIEEGTCYVHPSAYMPSVWNKFGNGGIGVISPDNKLHGHFCAHPYQQGAGMSQAGIVIPAGTYIFGYQYKCETSGMFITFTLTGTNGVSQTFSRIQTDSLTDGTAWHNVEVEVTVPETGLYTFAFSNDSGGNCWVSIDNVTLTCPGDIAMDTIPDQPYLGARVMPSVTVRDADGNVLVAGEDYDLEYGLNDGTGRGIGYVAAVGKGTHAGIVGRYFHIGTPFYVTPSGTSSNTGTSWADAVDFATALQKVAADTALPHEIWVAGSNVMSAAVTERSLSRNVVIRGGFAGTEATPDARVAGVRSVLDGQNLYDIAKLKNFTDVKFERFEFRNAPLRAVTKTGYAGDMEFRDCVFAANGANGGGATSFTGWQYNSDCNPAGDARFYGCTFLGNASGAGSTVTGGGIYANKMWDITLEDTLFASNGVSGATAYQKGAAIHTTLSNVKATRCEFRGNVGSANGGIVHVEGVAKENAFANCLFVNNAGMTSALTFAPDSVYRKAQVVNGTFAHNTGCSTSAAAGLQVSAGQVQVWNTIFYGNTNGETDNAADLRGASLATLTVGYTLFASDSSERYSFNNGASLAGGTCYFTDPLLVSETDAHLQSEQGYFDTTGGVHKSALDVRSPGIDAGDPSFDIGDEQEPNGEIINLGAYGGTRFASLTPVADPAISALDVAWDAKYTQPTVVFTAGGTGSYGADVTICVSTDGGESWAYVSDPIGGVTKGSTKSFLVPLYFQPGTKIWVKAVIHGAGKTVPSATVEKNVQGELPPWYGKKGPGNVIHVRAGATGAGDGTSWTDAIGFEAALDLVTEDKNEIWIAGTNVMQSVSLARTFTYPLKIRGGFTGAECAASERPAGVRSVLDGQDLYDILVFSNAKAVEVERLVFTRGAYRGMKKDWSNGDLTVTDCLFYVNGKLGTWEQDLCGGNSNECWKHGGAGLSVYGNGVAKVTIRNCRFEGNTTKSGTDNSHKVTVGYGGGAFVGSCVSALIDGCSFVTNKPGAFINWGGTAHALLLNATPFTLTNCLVVGHAKLPVGVCSASATVPNRIVNCRFVGNNGALYLTRDTAATNAVRNCTFAFNYGDAAFQLNRGTADVKDSIFWNIGPDMSFANSSQATLDYTLVGGTNTTWFGTGATFGEHLLLGIDPLFVSSTNEVCTLFNIRQLRSDSYTLPAVSELVKLNVHLKSRHGYLDETTGRQVHWPRTSSPAVDAGDPASSCANEPRPNGRRVNLGAYGNTPWATRSPADGFSLTVR